MSEPSAAPKRECFGPGALRVLAETFEDIWADLVTSGSPYAAPERAEQTKLLLARGIIAHGTHGKLNPTELRAAAIRSLMRSWNDCAVDPVDEPVAPVSGQASTGA